MVFRDLCTLALSRHPVSSPILLHHTHSAAAVLSSFVFLNMFNMVHFRAFTFVPRMYFNLSHLCDFFFFCLALRVIPSDRTIPKLLSKIAPFTTLLSYDFIFLHCSNQLTFKIYLFACFLPI